MRAPTVLAACLVAAAGAAAANDTPYAVVQAPAGTIKAALFSEQYANVPVASVDGHPVTLKQLSDALSSAHESARPTGAAGRKKDFTPVLDRLIGARLIALEAHDMGIDELPDIREEMERYADASLREVLKERLSKGIEADPAEADAFFKSQVQQWKVRAVFLPLEADAKDLVAAAGSGKNWDKAVAAAIAARKVKGAEESQYVSRKLRALAPVLDSLAQAKVGDVVGPLRLEKGFSVLKVEQVEYPEDPDVRREAEEWSKARRQTAAVYRAYKDLLAKRAVTDEKLLKSLDFEKKKPGFAALGKDRRPLVRIQGDKPVTVADLAQALGDEFFHGINRAIEEKKVNPRKLPVFENLVYQRLFNAEARRLGIPQSAEYQQMLAEHREALVFGKFVQKAVLPDVKVTEGDVKKYYDEHASQFTYPAFYTLASVAFEKQKDAQAALAKLKAGTDFKWLKSNLDGQLAEGKRVVDFDGTTVSERALPSELRKLLSTAHAGDLRLYSPDVGHYVVQVKAIKPPSPMSYVEAREEIAPRVQQIKVKQAIEEWIGKLRKAREVKVYITQIVS